MSTTTTTPRPGKTVATVAASPVPSVEDMRDAIAAANVTADVSGSNARALYAVVRARYAYHAATFSHPVNVGTDDAPRVLAVLPTTFRTDVASLMWRDATGTAKAVPAAERNAGIRSFAQYVSRFAGVASSMAFGVDALNGDADARAAEAALKVEKEREGKRNARTRRARAFAAFIAWRDALPQDRRAAVMLAFDLLTDGPGVEHAEAFATSLMNATTSA